MVGATDTAETNLHANRWLKSPRPGPPRQQWLKPGSPPNYQQRSSNEMSKNTNSTNNANPIVSSSEREGLISVEELFQIMTDSIPIARNSMSNVYRANAKNASVSPEVFLSLQWRSINPTSKL
jgi:hypothetical protein